MGSRRKVTPKKQMESREHLRFMPNDIVRAINGVTGAGLQVYAVEITPTGAINISTEPPHQVTPDKKSAANRTAQGRTTQHPSKNKLSRCHESKHSRRLSRFDYRYFDLCHRYGWSLPAVRPLVGPWSNFKNLLERVHNKNAS
jgi:hypothetical protein